MPTLCDGQSAILIAILSCFLAIKDRDAGRAGPPLVSHIRDIARRTLRLLTLDADPDLVFNQMFVELPAD